MRIFPRNQQPIKKWFLICNFPFSFYVCIRNLTFVNYSLFIQMKNSIVDLFPISLFPFFVYSGKIYSFTAVAALFYVYILLKNIEFWIGKYHKVHICMEIDKNWCCCHHHSIWLSFCHLLIFFLTKEKKEKRRQRHIFSSCLLIFISLYNGVSSFFMKINTFICYSFFFVYFVNKFEWILWK